MGDLQVEQDLPKYNECSNDNSQHSSEYNAHQDETVNGSRQDIVDHTDEDDDEGSIKIVKKRVQKFSDSESDDDEENMSHGSPKSSYSDNDEKLSKSIEPKNRKSRIKQPSRSGDTSDSDSSANEALKNEQQQLRMKNKRDKLKEKFKSLVTSRLTETQEEKAINSHSGSESESNGNEKEKVVNSDSSSDESSTSDKIADSTHRSDQEETSIEKIKQDVKQKSSSYKTTICDPDTSDEESYSRTKSLPQKKERKTAKMTSLKPVRMTAKQAMENMKKIKSESNRMLREKEVTLPYHRPKALSLKDIMSRRRPAVSSDGKSLPIKMNEDQLRQYAKLLEERQKEMMELCKSDTDEEPEQSEPQLEKSKEPESIHQSENMLKSENNQEVMHLENMDIDNDNKESNDNTNSLLEAHDNLTLVQSTNLDEGKNNIDHASAVIEHNMEKSESLTDNISVEVIDKIVSNVVSKNFNDLHNYNNNSEVKVIDAVNDSLNSNTSNAEMSLVYNDSIEEGNEIPTKEETVSASKEIFKTDMNKETEADSQLVSLHYDTEKTENNSDNIEAKDLNEPRPSTSNGASDLAFDEVCKENDFSDDDMINMDEIDNFIENAEILKDENGEDYVYSPMIVNDPYKSKIKPRLTGAPGMVIDLDDTDAIARKKLTGLELLKERFTYFAKLKTPEELEREKEKRLKPGAQHLKLKQELEEKIAEQRSLEWAKRLEDEKQQQMEMDAIRGDDSEDDIEKIEAKLEEKVEAVDNASSESEESEEEMQEVEDKPRKRNPMIDDEAEETDAEECEEDENEANVEENDREVEEGINNDADDEDNEDSSEESSDSEEEIETTTKRGRILKAFEDSDEEEKADPVRKKADTDITTDTTELINKTETGKTSKNRINLQSQAIVDSQDEDLQLAQRHKSFSDDLFTSQESGSKGLSNIEVPSNEETDIGTQTFSILNDATGSMTVDLDGPEKICVISETQPYDDPSLDAVVGMCSGSFSQNLVDLQLPSTGLPMGEKLSVISETQPNDEPNLDAVVGMCSGSFTQNLVASQPIETQPMGEDILNMCTGKFYDNQLISKTNDVGVKNYVASQIPNETIKEPSQNEDINIKTAPEPKQNENNSKLTQSKIHEDNNLKSILDELNNPEFEEPKPKKYFMDTTKENTQFKKKFIIDSDDETNDVTNVKQKKKIKKKKLEKRALRISDDEDEEFDEEYENDVEEQEYMSDAGEEAERLVEYDSEENEVEVVKPQKEKKKRKMAEFFEQEAELTSEDEWVGSGDEDERDLDRLEREEGDDDTFNQRKLQRELGQIHMRDVLDQDKREVRIIQELLFEDGDLGDGHRQRKFRWKNADGEEEGGIVPDEFADTQEEEMESEEQWRKQRHERELFLRQMQKQDEAEEELNVTINRTTIIKANLLSRTMSSLISEANKTANNVNKTTSGADNPVVLEKKPSKDIPSPKKAFTVFQQSYHGSLLTRGRGALARLAALATPLAVDDDAPKIGSLAPSSKRNFVFAALSQDSEPKVAKRKAETNIGTPRLVKMMKTEDKKKTPRSSLLDSLT